MTARLLLATRSGHKAREIQQLLPDGVRLITLEEAGLAYDPAEEDVEAFDTFRENALAKARHFFARSGLPTIADDSGIVVHALGGEPGVRSKRFAARPGLEGLELDLANNTQLLERLADTPDAQRTAHYACAAALVWRRGASLVALGTSSGTIVREPRGTGGFGYDPLFVPAGDDRTFAEMAADEKHRLSHRGRAFRALATSIGAMLH